MRAVIYARVSSQVQRDRHTIENQLRVLPEFIRAQGWTLVGTYVDDGKSAKAGKLEARTDFARLQQDGSAGAFDVVVVVDVDRLTRSEDMRERAEILGPFQRAGIAIATPAGGVLDLRSMMGEVYVSLQAIFAAEENRKRAARIKAGKLRAIAEGRKPAGPTPFGLRYSRAEGRWEVDPVQADIVREIVRRVIAGESCLAIGADFAARGVTGPRGRSIWERHTVWRIICSRHLFGEWKADKTHKLTIAVPPIVDRADWQAAQEALIRHGKRGLRRTRHVYLLEGLAVCGACGAPILVRSATPQRSGRVQPAAYICRRRKLALRGEARCGAAISPVANLDERVWYAVSAELEDPGLADELRRRVEQRAAERRDWTTDASAYRAHLARLERTEAAVLSRFRRGTVSEAALDVELGAIAREREGVTAQLEVALRAVQAAASPDLPADPAEWLATVREIAAAATPLERQRIVRVLVEPGSAVLHGHRLTLTLRIEAGAGSRGVDAAASLALVAASG